MFTLSIDAKGNLVITIPAAVLQTMLALLPPPFNAIAAAMIPALSTVKIG